jgi:hypothetical protein
MSNKRGQFYLIAALAIIGIMAGLSGVYSKIKTTEEDPTVYELSDEINYEIGQVIDSGVLAGMSQEEISRNIENLTDFYARSNPSSSLLAIYGNRTELTLLLYNNTGTGGITIGGGALIWNFDTQTKRLDTSYSPVQNNVNVTFGGITYFFNLKSGRVFFVILKKVKQDDIFVAVDELPSGGRDDSEGDGNELEFEEKEGFVEVTA